MKKLLAIMLVLSMILGLAACGSGSPSASTDSAAESKQEAAPAESKEEAAPAAGDAATDGVFRIGVFVQQTGGNAVAGLNALNGIKLATDYVNENGGFNGEQVELVPYDTTGSTEEAVKVVQKMIADDNVDAIIGSVNSNEVSACIKDINAAKV